LERQDGVADFLIDQQSNIVFISYKPDTHFDPAMLRAVAAEAEAVFVLIQVMGKGRIVEEGEKHFFVAGKDRFAVMETAQAGKPLPPNGVLVSVVASVDDSVSPALLRIVQFNPAVGAAAP
jgi:hypothetical protein